MNPNTGSASTSPQSIWITTANTSYPRAIIHGVRNGKCWIIYNGPVKETLIPQK